MCSSDLRKPRIFYVESGVASETFPFTKDTDRFLAFADSVGARYVLLDYMDDAATVYVTHALIEKGGSFCVLQAFGGGDAQPTQLFGILPPERRTVVQASEENGEVTVRMGPCPPEMTRQPPLAPRSARTEQIPLLVGFE